jgi:hypothetical protein
LLVYGEEKGNSIEKFPEHFCPSTGSGLGSQPALSDVKRFDEGITNFQKAIASEPDAHE